MFKAAFDASGTDNNVVLSVAGFVSSVKDWDDFSVKWEHRLSGDGISYFRAVEFAHSRGQFGGWKDQEERRRKLAADLMEVLKSHVYRKFGCSIVNKDFNKLDKSMREECLLSAYSVAGRTCEKDVREWARWVEKITSHVEPVFEQGDADQEKLRRRLARDLGCEPIFRPKKDQVLSDGSIRPRFVPLQAADWLAYELSLAVGRFGRGKLKNESDLRWPMQQFISIPGECAVYGAEEVDRLEEMLKLVGELSIWWREHGL
jgi:hypothetical protein